MMVFIRASCEIKLYMATSGGYDSQPQNRTPLMPETTQLKKYMKSKVGGQSSQQGWVSSAISEQISRFKDMYTVVLFIILLWYLQDAPDTSQPIRHLGLHFLKGTNLASQFQMFLMLLQILVPSTVQT